MKIEFKAKVQYVQLYSTLIGVETPILVRASSDGGRSISFFVSKEDAMNLPVGSVLRISMNSESEGGNKP